jgi:uncharacterized protein YegP (UPF0339 family)
MQFQKIKDRTKQWRMRLVTDNNKVIVASESYHNEADCDAAIELVRKATDAPVVIYDSFQKQKHASKLKAKV